MCGGVAGPVLLALVGLSGLYPSITAVVAASARATLLVCAADSLLCVLWATADLVAALGAAAVGDGIIRTK